MTIPERFAANVAWLFNDLPWTDRFAAARSAGFTAVEFPWPDQPAATAEAVRSAGLRVAMLNMPAGDLAAGERGWPNDPSRVEEWRSALRTALELAGELGCRTVNVLAGNAVADIPREAQIANLEQNLRWALPIAADAGTTLVSEVLNAEENPVYLLATVDDAEPLRARLEPLGWRLQLDTYHLGIGEPDVPAAIARAGSAIGHVQVADVPGRHEPGTGGLDWRAIGTALAEARYAGHIGLEYRPLSGLDWIERSPMVG